ncbi:MAG: aminodeoxychorismate synthase component I [Lachnospiraceae bacterium]|nr:aminodeoxychorismate synthase component I [Lachnospiraceae bacterium]
MRIIKKLELYPSIDRIFSLVQEQEDAVFLDSSLTGRLGQFSILGMTPYLKLVNGEEFTVNGIVSEEGFECFVKRYLREHQEENDTGLPLLSGAVGYFSYDYGRKKEGVSSKHAKEVEIPDCILVFYDNFIIEDHQKQRLYLVANDHAQNCEDGIELLQKLVERAEIQNELSSQTSRNFHTLHSCAGTDIHYLDFFADHVNANFTRTEYMDAVQNMINYIIEGDIYVVNMTQQLQIPSPMLPYDLFRQLRVSNPSPFGAYLNYGDFQIVCASPERFLQMRKGSVQTRPIKGTRKRGATPEEDEALRLELEQSEKDQSELLMIVDLERNDLNRVCIPGSVKVTELFTVETYATVFHLISNVVGQLSPDLTVMDLLEATFPGGSITGAPKLRAMELIDEQEHSRRNLYTGCIGYLSLDGDCDFNIVIRTALYQNGVYHLGVGGGITYESDLDFEYEETLQKAKALLEVLKHA